MGYIYNKHTRKKLIGIAVISKITNSGFDFHLAYHFKKESMKYIPCPECRGKGKQMIARMYPSGHTECWEDCEFCDGEGNFEEEDYLILKLQGKV